MMTPSLSKSLYLVMVGVTNFCNEGARYGGLGHRTLM